MTATTVGARADASSTPAAPAVRAPSPKRAAVSILGIVAIVGFFIFGLEASLHMALITAIVWVGILVVTDGNAITSVNYAMNAGVARCVPAFFIFLLIGVLIAALIEGGTVATLIYHGVRLLHPSVFLPTTVIVCSVMSVATGTAWGTVGTLGPILLGIGTVMQIPLPLLAGAVVSGASFGDKMSPVSDTTNLAALSAGTDLYSHIKGMLPTTVPAYLLALVCFTLFGLYSTDLAATMQGDVLEGLRVELSRHFSISTWTLLPVVTLLFLGFRRYDAAASMMAGVTVAMVLAVTLQERSISQVLESLYSGFRIQTFNADIDQILNRGGLASMMSTLSLSLLALALGGILKTFGHIEVIIAPIVRRVRNAKDLIALTIGTAFLSNLTMGEAYLSIILGGQLFSEEYRKAELHPTLLSRSLEEGATLTTGLIPWTTAGAFYLAALNVDPLSYAPYAFYNWLNPLVAIAMAYAGGFAIYRLERPAGR